MKRSGKKLLSTLSPSENFKEGAQAHFPKTQMVFEPRHQYRSCNTLSWPRLEAGLFNLIKALAKQDL